MWRPQWLHMVVSWLASTRPSLAWMLSGALQHKLQAVQLQVSHRLCTQADIRVHACPPYVITVRSSTLAEPTSIARCLQAWSHWPRVCPRWRRPLPAMQMAQQGEGIMRRASRCEQQKSVTAMLGNSISFPSPPLTHTLDGCRQTPTMHSTPANVCSHAGVLRQAVTLHCRWRRSAAALLPWRMSWCLPVRFEG
jgi:hypothetical protein